MKKNTFSVCFLGALTLCSTLVAQDARQQRLEYLRSRRSPQARQEYLQKVQQKDFAAAFKEIQENPQLREQLNSAIGSMNLSRIREIEKQNNWQQIPFAYLLLKHESLKFDEILALPSRQAQVRALGELIASQKEIQEIIEKKDRAAFSSYASRQGWKMSEEDVTFGLNSQYDAEVMQSIPPEQLSQEFSFYKAEVLVAILLYEALLEEDVETMTQIAAIFDKADYDQARIKTYLLLTRYTKATDQDAFTRQKPQLQAFFAEIRAGSADQASTIARQLNWQLTEDDIAFLISQKSLFDEATVARAMQEHEKKLAEGDTYEGQAIFMTPREVKEYKEKIQEFKGILTK